MDFIFNEIFLWLAFAYTVGTVFGYYLGLGSKMKNITEAVIDSLIEQKYLKTRGYGSNMEILKHTEWYNKDIDT